MIRLATIAVGLCAFAWIAAFVMRDPAFADYQRRMSSWHQRCDQFVSAPALERTSASHACAQELRELVQIAERKGWRGR